MEEEGVNIPIEEIQEQVVETHEEIVEKLKIKNKILRYQVLFPKHLAAFNYKMENLELLNLEQLNSLLKELEVIVNCQNSSGMTKMVYFESLRVVEVVSPLVGLKLNGLKEALNADENVINCLNEIQLKYESDSFMAPELRLGYCTLTAILTLHKKNSGAETVNNFLKEPVKKELLEEYNDL